MIKKIIILFAFILRLGSNTLLSQTTAIDTSGYRLIRYKIENLNFFIKISPDDPMHYFDRAILKKSMNDYVGAEQDYTKAIKISPTNHKFYYNRANLYSVMLENEKAMTDYKKAIELYPTYEYAFLNRALVFQRLKQYDKAIADFNKAIELNPTYFNYESRALCFLEVLDYKKALSDYSRMIRISPSNIDAYRSRAGIKATLLDFEGAIMDIDSAIVIAPSDSYLRLTLGFLYKDSGKFELAIQHFTKVIEMDSKVAHAYNGRGIAKAELKQYNEAIIDFKKAIELQPNNEKFKENLKGTEAAIK